MGRRVLGIVAMVFGVLGIVLGLILIGFVWAGRGAFSDQVAGLTSRVDSGLQRVSGELDDLSNRLENASEKVQDAANQAESLAQSSDIDTRLVDELVERLDNSVRDDYVRLREGYVAVQTRVDTLADVVQWADTLPAVDLPQVPGDRLQEIDSRLSEIDATLVGLRNELAAADLPITETVEKLAVATTRIANQIGESATSVDTYKAEVEGTQATVAQTVDSVQGWLTTIAIILMLVCLYWILLHVVLFMKGLEWYRSAAKEPSTVAAQAPS
jgi:hypothetical protein